MPFTDSEIEKCTVKKELAEALDVSYATVNRWENKQALPSKLAVKSFLDFCENNFIDTTDLED